MNTNFNIAIVDDETSIGEMLEVVFIEEGYNVDLFTLPSQFLSSFKKNKYDVMIFDLMMPQKSGIELIKETKKLDPESKCIIISAFGTGKKAKEALKFGAIDFIEKPFDIEKIKESIRKITLKTKTDRQNPKDKSHEFILGNSDIIKKLRERTKLAAKSDSTILITGETGTGKELVADTIHFYSNRKYNPFIKVNCSAISENLYESELFGHVRGSFTGAYDNKDGKFKLAEGGTLFLDEIGDLPLNAQAKLLRILQNKEFSPVGSTETFTADVRIISATNYDLIKRVEQGLFREDLYYRLNIIHITTPPLRDRKDDIKFLIEIFIKKFASKLNSPKKKISDLALQIMLEYSWAGNVRELENLIERFYVLVTTDTISIGDLPPDITNISPETTTTPTLAELEKSYIFYLLSIFDGNRTHTADVLEIDTSTLWRKLQKYGFDERVSNSSFEDFVNKANIELVEKSIIYYFDKCQKLNVEEISKLTGIKLQTLKKKIQKYEI